MSQATELIATQMAVGANIANIWGTIFYNPKSYGVKGDGSDETVVIQTFLNTVNTLGGGKVLFPPGTYKHGNITVPASIKGYFGSGEGLTTFECVGTIADYSAFLTFPSSTGCEASNFSMKVDKALYPLVQGIFFNAPNRSSVHDITVIEVGFMGIYSVNAVDSVFSRIKVLKAVTRGIYHEGSASRNTITEDCKVYSVDNGHGIQNNQGKFHVIRDCYAQDISFGFGMNMWDVSYGIIDDNRTLNTAHEGINIQNCSFSKVIDNTISYEIVGTDFGMSIWGTPASSSFGTGYAQYNVITGNTIFGSAKSGIALADNATDNVVSNNNVKNANQLNESQGAGIILYGSGCMRNIVSSNVISDTGTTVKYGVNEWTNIGSPDNNFITNNEINNFVTKAVNLLGANSYSQLNNPDEAWLSYTPTVTAGSGTITSYTATGFYRRLGKTVELDMTITITDAGTGALFIKATLPIPHKNSRNPAFAGREDGVSGAMIQGLIGGQVVTFFKYDGTYPGITNAVMKISGRYEIA